ncbi:hypothetical protein [Catellatospora chokoriensis]|uniref:Uncharacterized protein n=1 Tax=Catellatospora chokoriensis TaxID=310353 RepID=A0A8J3K3R1_9ACTN|nr:hypothetical protein [Catellatospora chokoriensis]GIF89778.1 hypothetical protein Cch02nite_32220 [Catellatospora chokoriensis]
MRAMIFGAVLFMLNAGLGIEPDPEPLWGTVCFDAQGNPSTTSQGGGRCEVVDLNEWAKTHPDICGPYNNAPCD